MISFPELVEVRIHAFKSVRDAKLVLGDLTLLVGRNGSGKSNVLDAITVLSRLATGAPLSDALDGRCGTPAIRGGSRACAPLGSTSFALGCSVRGDGRTTHLEVEVEVEPELRIRSEELRVVPAGLDDDAAAHLEARDLPADRGLSIAQSDALPASVDDGAKDLLDALRRVFQLSPVPAAMRGYVPASADRLRPGAENLSAVLARSIEQDGGDDLLDTLSSVTESRVVGLGVATTALGDVMFTQQERLGGSTRTVPARLMSDGTLHLLAVLAALGEADGAGRLLVLEEVESGLHPSQGTALVARILAGTREGAQRALVTTHSPAMLDALRGADHEGVVVCVRDDEGWSRLHRLVDLPNYFSLVAAGTLGGAASTDRLRPVEQRTSPADLIDRVFGDS